MAFELRSEFSGRGLPPPDRRAPDRDDPSLPSDIKVGSYWRHRWCLVSVLEIVGGAEGYVLLSHRCTAYDPLSLDRVNPKKVWMSDFRSNYVDVPKGWGPVRRGGDGSDATD